MLQDAEALENIFHSNEPIPAVVKLEPAVAAKKVVVTKTNVIIPESPVLSVGTNILPNSNHIEFASNASIVSTILKVVFLESIYQAKQHFMVSKLSANTSKPIKVFTAEPFQSSVDPLKFPDYPVIITNPMYLTLMEKKVNNNKYTQSLLNNQAGKSTKLSSQLHFLSYSNGSSLRPLTTAALVSAGTDSIWAFRSDVELIRNNAHVFNVGKFAELYLK